MQNARIKAIIVDVDGTLYRQNAMRRKMLWRLLQMCLREPRHGVQTICALQSYRHAQERLRSISDEGLSLPQEQLRLASEQSGTSFEFMSECVNRWIEREPLELLLATRREGVTDFLQAAVSSGLRLAVFSDYPAIDKLHALGLSGFFELVVSAQDPDVQAFKPNPRGLEVTLGRLGVSAHEAVYIGDRPETDAVAARLAGISCIIVGRSENRNHEWSQYENYTQLKTALLT